MAGDAKGSDRELVDSSIDTNFDVQIVDDVNIVRVELRCNVDSNQEKCYCNMCAME